MKKPLLIAATIILILTSCENDKSETELVPKEEPKPANSIDPDVIFRIGTSLSYKYSDIDLYDSSTHVLYFKTNHPEFDENSQSYFRFYVDTVTIFKGDFWPSFRSDLPTRPYISTWPFWFQNYVLRIENRENNKPDLRNDPRIIQAFKARDLLHSGLLVTMNSIECGVSLITFSYTVTNKDQSKLLIMDPNKMGLNYFHYFTNGLIFWKSPNTAAITVKIQSQSPPPSNTWINDWLTEISPGESKTFTINYPVTTPMSSGEYKVTFTFPGLFSLNKDLLFQVNGRIWLGDFKATKNIVIN
jgi:hypothetical protein